MTITDLLGIKTEDLANKSEQELAEMFSELLDITRPERQKISTKTNPAGSLWK